MRKEAQRTKGGQRGQCVESNSTLQLLAVHCLSSKKRDANDRKLLVLIKKINRDKANH